MIWIDTSFAALCARKTLSSPFGLAVAVGACVFLGKVDARAADAPDTVMLSNGGRMRGTVMEEDPQRGTSIKLLDGTVKRLAPAEVASVIHAGDAAPAPPSTPPPAPVVPLAPVAAAPIAVQPAAVPGAAPVGVLPALDDRTAYGAQYAPPVPRHRPGQGAVTAGLVILTLGGAVASVGGVVIGDGSSSNNDGEIAAGISTAVVGLGVFAVGGIVALIGVAIRASSADPLAPPRVAVEPTFGIDREGIRLTF